MLAALVRSLRPWQWVKNLFVLAPLVFAHRATEPDAIARALLAFGAFCAASSLVYLLNDWRDRDADRQHPIKRHRPIAAGTVGPGPALAAGLALAAAAAAASLGLAPGFGAVLAAYVGLNLLYSWYLKHVVILDVMTLSLGFVLRVEGGGQAVDVAVSSWLLLCTIFVSLFLAFSKRRHELVLLNHQAASQRRVLSSYSPQFLDQMINVVTASTVVCYALYAMADESVAQHGRGLVYTMPFVLFGVFRYLYLVYQKPSQDNPTEGILTDLPFLIDIALWAAAVVWILYV